MKGKWKLVQGYEGERIIWHDESNVPRIQFCFLATSGMGTPSDAISMAEKIAEFMNQQNYVPYPFDKE